MKSDPLLQIGRLRLDLRLEEMHKIVKNVDPEPPPEINTLTK
jgi:hypothetical protein